MVEFFFLKTVINALEVILFEQLYNETTHDFGEFLMVELVESHAQADSW